MFFFFYQFSLICSNTMKEKCHNKQLCYLDMSLFGWNMANLANLSQNSTQIDLSKKKK